MRYRKGHSEDTRNRIIEIASARFREEGLAALGIASVMAAAGLTHGGFYAHFESREDLVREVVLHGLSQRNKRLVDSAREGAGIADIITSYLSARHRDTPGKGCTVATLGPEIGRHSDGTRQVFTEGVETFLRLLASHWLQGTPEERYNRAIALYAMLIGTLLLARVTNDAAMSDQILSSGARAAIELSAAP